MLRIVLIWTLFFLSLVGSSLAQTDVRIDEALTFKGRSEVVNVRFTDPILFQGRGEPIKISFQEPISFQGTSQINVNFDKALSFTGRSVPFEVIFNERLVFAGRVNNKLEELRAYRDEVAEIPELFSAWYTTDNMKSSITSHVLTPEAARDSGFIEWLDLGRVIWDFTLSNDARIKPFMQSHLDALDAAIEELTEEADQKRVDRVTVYFRENVPEWRSLRKDVESAYFDCMLNHYLSAYQHALRYRKEYETNYWGEAREAAYAAQQAELENAYNCVSINALEEIVSEPAFVWP